MCVRKYCSIAMQKSKCLPAHWAMEDLDTWLLLVLLILMVVGEEPAGSSSSAKAKARIREAVKVTFPHVSTTWKPKKREETKVNSSILYKANKGSKGEKSYWFSGPKWSPSVDWPIARVRHVAEQILMLR